MPVLKAEVLGIVTPNKPEDLVHCCRCGSTDVRYGKWPRKTFVCVSCDNDFNRADMERWEETVRLAVVHFRTWIEHFSKARRAMPAHLTEAIRKEL